MFLSFSSASALTLSTPSPELFSGGEAFSVTPSVTVALAVRSPELFAGDSGGGAFTSTPSVTVALPEVFAGELDGAAVVGGVGLVEGERGDGVVNIVVVVVGTISIH